MRVIFLVLLLMSNLVHAEGEPTFLPGTKIIQKAFELKYQELEKPSRELEDIISGIAELSNHIGSYPPLFKDEAEREQVYLKWQSLLSDALVYDKQSPNDLKVDYSVSELYRQGHNLDVVGAAEKAHESIQGCIEINANYMPCHFSASYFYLSINPNFIEYAEKSLKALREHYGTNKHPEVESGYVFYYIYLEDVDASINQINNYLSHFDDGSERIEFFKLLKADLEKDKTIKTVEK